MRRVASMRGQVSNKPKQNLTFAETVEQIRIGECGRPHLPTDDRAKFAAERLLPRVTNWRRRTIG